MARHERPLRTHRIRPGKITLFVAAVGVGEEAGDMYRRPDVHGLVGNNSYDMVRRLAERFGWPSPEALAKEVDRMGSPNVPPLLEA